MTSIKDFTLPIESPRSFKGKFLSSMKMEAYLDLYLHLRMFLYGKRLYDPGFYLLIGQEMPAWKRVRFYHDPFLMPVYRIFFIMGNISLNRSFWKKQLELDSDPYYLGKVKLKPLNTPLFTIGFADNDIISGRPSLSFTISLADDEFLSGLPNYLYFERFVKGHAQTNMVQLVLAATAYKTTNGKYPDSLERWTPDFIGEIPLDPYDGKQIKMRKVKDGLILYSAGRDGIDGGGKEIDDLTLCLGSAYIERRLNPSGKVIR